MRFWWRGLLFLKILLLTLFVQLNANEKYKFKRYSVNEGLHHTHVLSIYQDSKGFIWFGTFGGLHLFNGYNFQIYTEDWTDSTSISNNTINTILEDRNGFLWFGTEYGLNRYNRKTGDFENFVANGSSASLSHFTLKASYEHENGDLWFGTYGGGLNKYIPEKNGFEFYNSEKLGIADNEFDKINVIHHYKGDLLWIGTEGGGLFIFDSKLNKVVKQFKRMSGKRQYNSIIASIYKDDEDRTWVGTWNEGLFFFDETLQSFKKIICHPEKDKNIDKENVLDIKGDNEGNLWIAHYGAGITKYNPQSNSFENYFYDKENKNSIGSNFVWRVLFDKTGNLWVGTFGGGLSKCNTRQKRIPLHKIPYEIISESENKGVSSIFEDSSGQLWIGTQGSKLINYNLESDEYKQFEFSDHKDADPIHNIFEDKDKQLWVGTEFGLFRIDSSRKSVIKFKHNPQDPSSISDSPIYKIMQDSDGNIWIGTSNSGVFMLRSHDVDRGADVSFLRYQRDDSKPHTLQNNTVYDLCEDEDKNIWIATSQYLEKLDRKTDRIKQVLYHSMSSVVCDDEGFLWGGTFGEGIYKINTDGEMLKKYQSVEELSLQGSRHVSKSTVLSMIMTKDKEIWLTTNKGVSLYDIESETFTNYSLIDELQQNSLIISSLFRLKSGKVLIGGIDGFNILERKEMSEMPEIPSVIFSDFRLYNQSIVYDISKSKNARIKIPAYQVKELLLSYKDDLILIEFAALEYNEPDRIKYAYKLEGFDENWINTSANMRYANYSNLKPGTYIFKVKASSYHGEWDDKETSLKIVISPPFWETLWFRFLAFAIGVLLIVLVVRLRTRSLQLQKKALEKQVNEKTSEIQEQYKILEDKNAELSSQKEEILAQKDEIIAKTDEVKRANEKKLQFFTSMSHEFRTPLTLILGPVENLLEKHKNDKESKYYLSVAQKNANRLLRLINEILDLRKMDSMNMKIKCIHADIIAFSKNLLMAFEALANKSKVQLKFNADQDSFFTWFDTGKIEIILYNLISNALKFTPENGIITLSSKIDATHIFLKVSDTGIGIDEEAQKNIFDRFYQVESNSVDGNKGTGIGLSLTHEIVKYLGGNIEVVSSIGKGTSFTVELPIINKDKEHENIVFNESVNLNPDLELISQIQPIYEVDEPYELIQEVSEDVEKKTILVVEDDEDLRNYVVSCLSDTYSISEAGNGKEGLEKAKEVQPHLIISDIMMPVMDGIEFCDRIKADFNTSHIPVVLLSAKTTLESQLEGFETGADAFIPKPFNKKYLQTRVKTIIKSRDRLRELFQNKLNIEPKEITVTSVDEKFIENAKEMVENNIDNSEFGVNNLVEGLGMSRTLLHMKFKKLLDCSTGEFIKTMRLKRACQLLSQKKHRVSDVCYMVGFNDPHSFSKSFKKHFGETPTQFANKS